MFIFSSYSVYEVTCMCLCVMGECHVCTLHNCFESSSWWSIRGDFRLIICSLVSTGMFLFLEWKTILSRLGRIWSDNCACSEHHRKKYLLLWYLQWSYDNFHFLLLILEFSLLFYIQSSVLILERPRFIRPPCNKRENHMISGPFNNVPSWSNVSSQANGQLSLFKESAVLH